MKEDYLITRIKDGLRRANVSAAEASRLAVGEPGAIKRIMDGHKPSFTRACRILEALKMRIEVLDEEEGPDVGLPRSNLYYGAANTDPAPSMISPNMLNDMEFAARTIVRAVHESGGDPIPADLRSVLCGEPMVSEREPPPVLSVNPGLDDGSARGLGQHIDPQDAKACYSRSNAKAKLGDYKEAIADYDRALKLDPQFAGAYSNRGVAKAQLGDYKGALADFEQALQIDPQFAQAYSNRGNVRNELGDHDGAIADHNQALQIDPQNAKAYSNRGNAKNELGDHDGAIADYGQALQIDPQLAETYSNRGVAKNELGDHDGAIADHNQALQMDPQIAGAYSNRGVAKAQLGD